MKLMVVSAISRESSTTHILARLVADICREHGADVDFVTPADVGVPVNDGTVPFDLPEAKAWQDRVAAIHAHIWISPEYHSAVAASMKNLFDYLGKEPMRGDVIGLCAIAGGGMAALNTLNGMTVIARSLGAWVAPDYCAFRADEVKDLPEESRRRLEMLCVSVIDAARRFYTPAPESSVGVP